MARPAKAPGRSRTGNHNHRWRGLLRDVFRSSITLVWHYLSGRAKVPVATMSVARYCRIRPYLVKGGAVAQHRWARPPPGLSVEDGRPEWVRPQPTDSFRSAKPIRQAARR